MGYGLIDYYLGFEDVKRRAKLSGNVRAVYYELLSEFNRLRYPADICLAVRELKYRSGVKSISSVHDALSYLKLLGLIDYKRVGGVTHFRLKSEHMANRNRTPSERPPNAVRTAGGGEIIANSTQFSEVEVEKEVDGASARGGEAVDWREFVGTDVDTCAGGDGAGIAGAN
ncbi:MAG: hypothetical protein IKN16_08205 [Selenomonadaceae bacterium]|nr:hypothetical protein [Selenomonadaceae bacterium]MBR6888412.1 hypothetical protein [Selenomonadaceae bacterium]